MPPLDTRVEASTSCNNASLNHTYGYDSLNKLPRWWSYNIGQNDITEVPRKSESTLRYTAFMNVCAKRVQSDSFLKYRYCLFKTRTYSDGQFPRMCSIPIRTSLRNFRAQRNIRRNKTSACKKMASTRCLFLWKMSTSIGIKQPHTMQPKRRWEIARDYTNYTLTLQFPNPKIFALDCKL